MNPILSKSLLIFSVIILGTISWMAPQWLSDSNPVLADFVDIDFANFLGLILTITLASLAQLNLSLRKISTPDARHDIADLRVEIKNSAVYLVSSFAISFVLAITKPLIACTQFLEAIFNSIAILIIIFFLLILVDIAFAILDLDEQ